MAGHKAGGEGEACHAIQVDREQKKKITTRSKYKSRWGKKMKIFRETKKKEGNDPSTMGYNCKIGE